MPPLYHKYRHLSRGILIKIRKNNQILKDQCQDFQERAASRQAAVLSASLPHYTLYRLFVKPSCTIIRNYLEVFISCRKSLPAKDLRRRGAAPPVLSRCHQRTYNYSEKIGKMSIDTSSLSSSSCWISDMQAISSHSKYSD